MSSTQRRFARRSNRCEHAGRPILCEIMLHLEVHPEVWGRLERGRQQPGRFRCDATLAIDELADLEQALHGDVAGGP